MRDVSARCAGAATAAQRRRARAIFNGSRLKEISCASPGAPPFGFEADPQSHSGLFAFVIVVPTGYCRPPPLSSAVFHPPQHVGSVTAAHEARDDRSAPGAGTVVVPGVSELAQQWAHRRGCGRRIVRRRRRRERRFRRTRSRRHRGIVVRRIDKHVTTSSYTMSPALIARCTAGSGSSQPVMPGVTSTVSGSRPSRYSTRSRSPLITQVWRRQRSTCQGDACPGASLAGARACTDLRRSVHRVCSCECFRTRQRTPHTASLSTLRFRAALRKSGSPASPAPCGSA